jgi:hypothetical protein
MVFVKTVLETHRFSFHIHYYRYYLSVNSLLIGIEPIIGYRYFCCLGSGMDEDGKTRAKRYWNIMTAFEGRLHDLFITKQ